MIKTYPAFDTMIGQDKAKARLDFYLECFSGGGIIPNVLLVAPKGVGKTKIASLFGMELHRRTNGEKGCHIINCSTIKNVGGFVNQIIIPLLVDKHVTLILDEASELPKDVTMFLLSCLEPGRQVNNVVHDDYHIEIDFARHTFVLATSEGDKVFPPLKDRCTRVELEEYSPEHIAKIIKLQGIQIVDDVLKSVAKVCRGNARQAVSLAQEVKRYQKMRGGMFTKAHWQELCEIVGILPLGLSEMELSLLRVLKDRPEGTSLTRIGACLGLSKTSIQADLELYPAKMGLLEITTTGRVLTPKGQAYLKENKF